MPRKVRLAENIRIQIQKRGLTISQTAGKIGMNKATLHNYSNGVVPRNITTLMKLAEFFGVTLSDLLYGAENQLQGQGKSVGKNRFILTIEALEDGSHDDN